MISNRYIYIYHPCSWFTQIYITRTEISRRLNNPCDSAIFVQYIASLFFSEFVSVKIRWSSYPHGPPYPVLLSFAPVPWFSVLNYLFDALIFADHDLTAGAGMDDIFASIDTERDQTAASPTPGNRVQHEVNTGSHISMSDGHTAQW